MRKLAIVVFALLAASPALATLTATPITWNVIGLDSNSPAAGPNRFPAGARVCSNVATTSVVVNWVFDSANANINLRPGSLSSITFPSIAAGACADAYFEIEITPVAAAYDTTRRYHITASDFSGTVSTPTPRELYVEHLISQSRNSTTGVKLDGVPVPPGGTMSLVVGNTYTIELDGGTATQGYAQLEEFMNFSNTIFQILAVSTTYSADTSPFVPNPNDKLYADACGWENDPNSPNYRSCVGGAGKTGGTVNTVYTVKIIGGGGTTRTLSSLTYDFSGSSYHYNSDLSVGGRIATIIDPTLVTISKNFTPDPSTVGGVSTLTFTLMNPNGGSVGSLNFSDVFPTSPGAMVVANPSGATTTGCGAPTFAPAAGAASIAFSNGTVAANSSCTVSVQVTTPTAGTYSNTSGHLFIGSVDTGSFATDSLTVSATPPPPPPVCGVTLANWSVPDGTVANPPDLAGGVPTVKAANVATATLAANLPGSTTVLTVTGHGDSTSWRTFGYKTAGQFITFTVDTSKYTAVQMSFWVGNPSPANGPTQITLTVDKTGTGTGFGAPVLTINNPPLVFTNSTVNLTGLTNTTGNTLFRLTATGAANDNGGASLNYDDIVFTGCTVPGPPTIAKAFAPNPVAVGATSTLTFTLTNPNAVAETGLAFTDTLPAGLTAPNGTTAPCGGSLVITGGNLLTFSGGTLAAGGSCTIPVTVTATTAGPHANVSGFVSSTTGGTNTGATGVASASLTAVLPPSIAKQFAPSSILALGVSTLTFTVTNPNQNDTLSSVAFSDTFPTSPGAMVVAAAPGASTSGCGAPTFAPAAGAGSVSFTGGTISGGATCTVTVNVTAPAAGAYANTSGSVSSLINGVTVNGNTAAATLTVTPPHPAIGILKQVGLTSNPLGTWSSFLPVAAGTNVFYKITIENDGDVPLSPVSASDPNVNLAGCVWPPSLPVAVAGNENHIATCVVGPVAAVAGLHPNTATASGTGGGSTVTDTSTATYATTGLTIAKSAAESSFSAAGDLLHYSYLVTNSGFATLAGPVTVTDTKVAVTCPALTTIGDLDSFFDPGEAMTCTATYTVTAADVAALSVTNQAFATVSGVNSPAASKTVPLAGTLSITKSFAAANVALGSTVNMSFLMSNPSGTPLTGIAFTDTLPAGLTAANGTTTPCGGSLTVSGGNSLSFSGGSLAAGTSCTINVTVTGATAGVKNNTTGPISSNEGGVAGTSNTATVTVLAPPTIGKTFGAASIVLSGTTSLNLTLTNPNATVALSGIAFTDSLPAGLTAPNGTTTPCGGTLTITGTNLLTFTGGTLAAGGSCGISVTVTGATAGVKNNTTSAITSTGPISLTGTTSNTATVTVTAPTAPTIAKSFAAPDVALGGSVNMSFLLTNSSATPLTGVAFTDALPAGLTAPNGTTTPCGGSLVIAGGNSLTFSGGTLAAGTSCTITVTVTGAVAGVQNNTTGPISSTESGAGAPSNTATVTVLAPPTIAKSFVAGSIPLAGNTGMDLVLTNPNATVALSGIGFTDTLPAGLTAPNGTTTPCGGTLVITGSNLLTFTGGTLAAAANCTITVTVTGTTVGVKNNTTSAITSTGPIALTGTTSNTATVTVTPPGAPTITKSFAAPEIALGGTVGMSFLLNNPSATPLTGVTFSDTLPAGLTAPNGTTTPCGGTLAIAGGTSLTFTGGTLAAGGNCTITVTVTGASAGVKNNTTGPISSNESGAGGTSNTATVTVLAPPTIAKAFGSGSIALSTTTSLDLTLTNPNATVALTGVAFTDSLPAGLTAPNGTTTPCGGTLVITGGNLLTFTGGALAAGGSCPISVTVTGVAIGIQNNTTGAITSTGPIALTGTTSNTATVTVTAPGAPTIVKSFAGANVALGGTVGMSFLLNNSSATPLTGVAFSDSLPAGLTAANGTTAQCGGSVTVTGGNTLTFSGGGLAPGASCTITVTVTGSAAGVQNNTTGPITSNESGAGGPSNTATVTVVVPPTIAKAFGVPSIVLSTTTSLDLTLANPNATVALTGIDFTDSLPAGLTAPNGTTTPCGGTLTITGGNLLTFTGGTLAAGASCPISVTVTGSAVGVQNNTTSPVTASGPVSLTGTSSNTATVTVTAPNPPTIAKSFSAADVALGGTVNMSFLLTNSSVTPLTGVLFSDALPAGLTAPNGTTTPCGGTLVIAGGTGLTFSGGTLAAGASCTINVTVTGATAGVKNNTTGPISSTESGPGGPSNTATVTVVAPPTIAKTFGAASIALSGTTNLDVTLANPNATVALTGIAFTDSLPAGLTAPNGTTTPCGGTLTITGGNLLTFTGGTVAAGGNCLISVTVTGATTGVKNNTTSAVTATGPISLTGVVSNTATVTVTAPNPPTIAKSFAAPEVALGGSVNMSFLLTNSSATPLTGVAFTDALPAGLTAPNGTTTPCGGSLVIAGGTALTFSGGTLAAGGNCTITVPVTGSTAGIKNNTTGPIGSTESGAGSPSNTATVTVLAPPTIAKAFGSGSIPLSGTTSLDLVVTNPNATVALSGVAFTDTLPAGLTAPNGTTTPCGGTLTITGSNLLTFTGGTLAAGASCPISVTVTGATTGIKNNTTSAITSTGPIALTGTTSNTATVTVIAPGAPTIAKSFAAPDVALGGTVDMSFPLTNASATPLTGVAFSDTLPAGLTAPNGTTTPCGGSLVITGGTGLAFSGGTLAAGGNCTITVTVTGAVAGVQNNTTGPISSTESGAGAPSNTATVTVLAPPTIAKSFVAGSIPLSGNTGMDLVLTNPNATVALTGIDFTDTLPSGLTAPNGTTTPCGGTLTITGSNLLTFTGGTLAAAANCTITVTVTGVATGIQNNTTSAITSTGPIALTGTTSNTATVTVTAPGAPTITKSFTAPDVALGGTVDMSFLLNNPSATPLTGVTFSDTLPAGLTAPNGTTTPCGGSLVITGGTGLAFSGGTLAVGGSCTITVTVTGAAAGVENNTTGPISSIESGAGGPSNMATVTVLAPPTIAKAFGVGSIPLSGTTSLDLTLANPNATVALSGVAFTDTLPAGLTAPNGTTTPCGGTLTITLGNLLTFTGGSLAAGASCPISVTVTGVAIGIQNNATSAITSTGPVSLTGAASNTATVTVTAPGAPTIAKSFAGANVALGGTVDMSFVLTNSSVTPLTGVAFSDSLPAGLTAPNGTTAQCGGSLVITGGNLLTFSGGGLAPGASCTITVTVTGAVAGIQNNTTGPISSNESGAGGPSNTATVAVLAPPTIAKAFGAGSIPLSGTTTLDLTLTNPDATVALTGVDFTDALPAGLTAPNGTTTPCGGTLVITGGNLLTFTGGTLAAGASCPISITVTGVAIGIQNNTTSPVTASGPVSLTGAPSNTATVTVTAPGAPTITKSFAGANVALGGAINVSFLLNNPSITPLTGVAFSDSLPAGLTAANGAIAACGGTLTVTGGNLLTFSGGTLAATTGCTVTVAVTGAAAGVQNNTTGPIGSNESGPGGPSNTATVTVVVPPSIAKAFGTGSISVGATTSLTLTLTNPNVTVALTGVAFTDSLPSGLTAGNGTTAPCGGLLSITGGNLLTFTGGTLAPAAGCSITVTVTGASVGIQNNTTSPVTATGPVSLTGAPSNTATVTITAPGTPTIAKSFSAANVALGATVNVSFVITNPGSTTLTGLAFTDTLPSGLTAPNGTTPTCGGTLTIGGGNLLTFSGGTLAGVASCTITVPVTGSAAGVQNNVTGPISSTETGAGAPSNTATVTVIAPPTIAKSFGTSSMPVNGTTSLDLTLGNPNATVALSGLAFTDTLPSGLTATDGTTTPCGGTLTITGGNLLTFAGGTLAAGGSCTITVTVTGISTGAQNNTTSPLTASGPLSVSGPPSNTATVTVGTGAVNGIPTLGPWMLLSLAALLALAGVRFARR